MWTEEQSAALRRAKDSDLPLDWENLAEKIESLGKSQRAELNSQIRRILRHLFKQGATAAKLAADDLEGCGEPADLTKARLDDGGFTAEQVLADWFPEPGGGAAHRANR